MIAKKITAKADVGLVRVDGQARHQLAVQALSEVEALAGSLLRLLPCDFEHCAAHTLLRRIVTANAVALGSILDDGDELPVLQQMLKGD